MPTLNSELTSGSAAYARFKYTVKSRSGNTFYIDYTLEVETDNYMTRSCWYYLSLPGVDENPSYTHNAGGWEVASSGYNHKVETSDGYMHVSFGFGYVSSGSGTQECWGGGDVKLGDPMYTVYYYDRGTFKGSYDLNKNASHSIVNFSLTYAGDGTSTTNFTITGNSNGASVNGTSITATKTVVTKHTHTGWSTSSSASSATYGTSGTITVTSNIYLYAVWRDDSSTTYSNNTIGKLSSLTWPSDGQYYTITLNVNADNATVSTTKLEAGKVTTHTFKGWGASPDSTTPLAASTSYTSKSYVYAIWDSQLEDNSTVELPTPTRSDDITYHTVTLNGNGGTTTTTSIRTSTVVSWTFKGWSTTPSASSGITGSYTPTSNKTFYATWASSNSYPEVTLPTTGLSKPDTENKYTTTLILNGGTHSKTSVSSGYSTSYKFNYWSSSKSGSSVGTSISGNTYSTLYAIWTTSGTKNITTNLGTPTKSIPHTVTFDASGGTVSPTSKYVYSTYSFLGWYTTNSSSGTKVSNPSSYYTHSTNTLYAIWATSPSISGISLPTPSRSAVNGTFTITLDGNGGSIASSVTNPIVANSNTSFIFSGWSTVSGDSSSIVTDTSNYTTASNKTLYAIWIPDTNTSGISLPTSGITKGNSIVTSYTITLKPIDGSVSQTSINTNKIRRYTFKGWSPTGSTSNMVSSTNYIPTANITLKAAYNTADSVNPVDLPDASKVDHSFLGWSTVEDGTSYVAKRYTASGNITLYANYLSNYRASLWIWYNEKWNKCIVNLFTGDRFTDAV